LCTTDGRDFAAISERVAKLQPYLDRAHSRIVTAPLDLERLPFGSSFRRR
jgi:hypothetical protein